MNLPNKLSILRIILIPIFVAFYFIPYAWSSVVALCIFLLAAFTDFLDGYIARKYNLVTDLGKLLDPIADKILVCAALFCVVATNPFFVQDTSSLGILPAPNFGYKYGYIILAIGSTIILARELLISAVRQIAASKGNVLQANIFGKIKTFLQDVTIPFLVILQSVKFLNSINDFQIAFYQVVWYLALILFLLTIIATVFSGVIYLVQNRSVFVEKEKESK